MKRHAFSLAVLCSVLCLFLSGCFARPRQITQAESIKREAILTYDANTRELLKAAAAAYQDEGRNHVATRHAWDQEKITGKAQEILSAQADAQNVPPARVQISAEQFKQFAAEARSWSEKIAAEARKADGKLEAKVRAFEALVAKAQIDLATALKLQDLLDRFYEAGIPPELIQEGVRSISNLVRSAGSLSPAPSANPLTAPTE